MTRFYTVVIKVFSFLNGVFVASNVIHCWNDFQVPLSFFRWIRTVPKSMIIPSLSISCTSYLRSVRLYKCYWLHKERERKRELYVCVCVNKEKERLLSTVFIHSLQKPEQRADWHLWEFVTFELKKAEDGYTCPSESASIILTCEPLLSPCVLI